MQNPSSEHTIGPAFPADIEAIDRIEREAFNTPWSRDLLRGAIVNRQYRVRVMRSPEGNLTGFYIAHTTSRQSNLDNVAVDDWARGQGHGSRLLEDWILSARNEGHAALTLQVNTANRRAQKLYERFRFRTSRLLVSYYPNGEDAFQMVRNLLDTIYPDPQGRVIRKTGGRAHLTLLKRS